MHFTDLVDDDIAHLEARYRGRGRAERNICDAKTLGLANLPSASFGINHAWLLSSVAQDLLAWTRLLTIDGDLTRAEPQRLRLPSHAAARLGRTSRQRWIRIPDDWPWAAALVAAIDRLEHPPLRV